MEEYLAAGVRLGWLFDRKAQQVEIYRPEQPKESLLRPKQLSDALVLPGFVLNLDGFW